LLLGTWIGRRLARTCAANPPRWRFRVLGCLVSLGFTAAGLAIAFSPQPFVGEVEVEINLRVVDRNSSQAVAAAFVNLCDAFAEIPGAFFSRELAPSCALTDRQGRARLVSRFIAEAEHNAFQTMGGFSPWGRWLEVSAAGYKTVRMPLSEVIGFHGELGRPYVRTIALDRGTTPKDPCADICGIYTWGSTDPLVLIVTLEIRSDGRFAWTCADHHWPFAEYGTVKRRNRDIELLPVWNPDAKHPHGRPWMLQTIEWGDRPYLSDTDEYSVHEFCRAALFPNEWSRTRLESYPGYLRRADLRRRQFGLPKLPARVWLTFLLNKLRVRDQTRILSLALDLFVGPRPH
jgi:hypothetical protein